MTKYNSENIDKGENLESTVTFREEHIDLGHCYLWLWLDIFISIPVNIFAKYI